jgi:hypothetical protein
MTEGADVTESRSGDSFKDKNDSNKKNQNRIRTGVEVALRKQLVFLQNSRSLKERVMT